MKEIRNCIGGGGWPTIREDPARPEEDGEPRVKVRHMGKAQ